MYKRQVLETAKEVYQARTTRIPTARLNEEMLPLIEAYPPPSNKEMCIRDRFYLRSEGMGAKVRAREEKNPDHLLRSRNDS